MVGWFFLFLVIREEFSVSVGMSCAANDVCPQGLTDERKLMQVATRGKRRFHDSKKKSTKLIRTRLNQRQKVKKFPSCDSFMEEAEKDLEAAQSAPGNGEVIVDALVHLSAFGGSAVGFGLSVFEGFSADPNEARIENLQKGMVCMWDAVQDIAESVNNLEADVQYLKNQVAKLHSAPLHKFLAGIERNTAYIVQCTKLMRCIADVKYIRDHGYEGDMNKDHCRAQVNNKMEHHCDHTKFSTMAVTPGEMTFLDDISLGWTKDVLNETFRSFKIDMFEPARYLVSLYAAAVHGVHQMQVAVQEWAIALCYPYKGGNGQRWNSCHDDDYVRKNIESGLHGFKAKFEKPLEKAKDFKQMLDALYPVRKYCAAKFISGVSEFKQYDDLYTWHTIFWEKVKICGGYLFGQCVTYKDIYNRFKKFPSKTPQEIQKVAQNRACSDEKGLLIDSCVVFRLSLAGCSPSEASWDHCVRKDSDTAVCGYGKASDLPITFISVFFEPLLHQIGPLATSITSLEMILGMIPEDYVLPGSNQSVESWDSFSKTFRDAAKAVNAPSFLFENAEDGDELEKVKKAKEFLKDKGSAVVDGLKTLAEKAQDKFNKAKAKKEEIEEKLKDAKAKFDAAREKGGEILAQAKATWEELKKQFDAAKATLKEAKAELANAGLIEQEDGDESKKPRERLKKLADKVSGLEDKASGAADKVKDWKAKAEDKFNKKKRRRQKSREASIDEPVG
eukprot:CAMPEP_0172664480 /NCGR_PEP_ID=MMETSP1074-20121228/6625_1 /TAXON_ID=2916 /ORGANISM="Ceratium fusus, Strain PA161109" /LENGTH=729 /DNA_ID=CAMNT_0013480639 /DNA_START=79 /DNA_END=2268 /DNA_ORIENTATION=+